MFHSVLNDRMIYLESLTILSYSLFSVSLSLFLFYYLYFSLPTHPLLLPQQLGNRAIAE